MELQIDWGAITGWLSIIGGVVAAIIAAINGEDGDTTPEPNPSPKPDDEEQPDGIRGLLDRLQEFLDAIELSEDEDGPEPGPVKPEDPEKEQTTFAIRSDEAPPEIVLAWIKHRTKVCPGITAVELLASFEQRLTDMQTLQNMLANQKAND